MHLLLILSLAIGGPSPAASTGLCSLDPFSATRAATGTYLLAEALPDTVLAGPGEIQPSDQGGHWGRGAAREIYGQVLRVDRFGGSDSVALAAAFARNGSREVIAVPWDYDPACEPTIWSRSAHWTRPGLTGVYTRLSLRPESQWIAGVPTLDAQFADIEPYPHGIFFQRGYRGTDAVREEDALTAEEYFELYRRLPTGPALDADRDAAIRPLREWLDRHPGWAERYPADEILRRHERMRRRL